MKPKQYNKLTKEQKDAITCNGKVVYSFVSKCNTCGDWFGADKDCYTTCPKCDWLLIRDTTAKSVKVI